MWGLIDALKDMEVKTAAMRLEDMTKRVVGPQVDSQGVPVGSQTSRQTRVSMASYEIRCLAERVEQMDPIEYLHMAAAFIKFNV